MVQGILSIPPGSTLQSKLPCKIAHKNSPNDDSRSCPRMVREQNLVTLEGLLQDSTILANVEGDSLRVDACPNINFRCL